MIAFSGTIWRIMAQENAHSPLAAARAPEGRFHHSGQFAIYTSLTAKGAGIAIQHYFAQDTRPKVIVPILVEAHDILDLRGTTEDIQATTMVCQDNRAKGLRAPNWDVSGLARTSGRRACFIARARARILAIWCCLARLIRVRLCCRRCQRLAIK
ncbi:MAG: RES domain-containing protein [Paracoccaceae bacterium]|jgi:RES domain-containing protein